MCNMARSKCATKVAFLAKTSSQLSQLQALIRFWRCNVVTFNQTRLHRSTSPLMWTVEAKIFSQGSSMKRKHDPNDNTYQFNQEKKTLKTSRLFETFQPSGYYNKSRGALRIKDESLTSFFAEFVCAAKTPLHFFVLTKLNEQEARIDSKFKVMPDSFIRMIACLLIHHR